jgi:hypothetical protein
VALVLFASIGPTTGYGLVAAALAIMGFGMGTTMAPATESIMGSLPLAKAGVGSAMNDTTRQVGGALGVAVIGSVLSSGYASSIATAVKGLPAAAAAQASDSVGGAAAVAHGLGSAGRGLVLASHTAFVDGLSSAVWVAVAATLAGVLVSLFFLPSRPISRAEPEPQGEAENLPSGVDVEASIR